MDDSVRQALALDSAANMAMVEEDLRLLLDKFAKAWKGLNKEQRAEFFREQARWSGIPEVESWVRLHQGEIDGALPPRGDFCTVDKPCDPRKCKRKCCKE